jgi:hypothetical protein
MISTIKIEVELQDLLTVLGKTGNTEIAIQILKGTYQEPEFDKSDKASLPDKEGKIKRYAYISYDIWEDNVHYKEEGHWTRTMSRSAWENLDLWEHIMDSQAHDYQLAP